MLARNRVNAVAFVVLAPKYCVFDLAPSLIGPLRSIFHSSRRQLWFCLNL